MGMNDYAPDHESSAPEWSHVDVGTIPLSTRAHILREAEHMVCGHREQDYGSPEDSFAVIAALWSAYLDYEITPKDVAMLMALLKIARIRSGKGTADSFIDLAGYAACGGEIAVKNN